jgi:fido (protein-threonine AMPylation protein)
MSVFFKNREGQTPLEEEMRFDLKLKHVQDMTELYELESENIAIGIAWSRSTNLNHLEYPTWLERHKKMLGDIWKFAGTIRKIELNNPDFHMPYNIRPALLELEKDLKYWIEHNTYEPKLMMAYFHERLLTIHPFKDGNGRWSRVLTEFICLKENFDVPNWGAGIKEDELRRKAYIDAIKSARHQYKHQELADVMFSTIF